MHDTAMMLSERRRALLVLNGVGLLISAALSGWVYFFFLLGAIDLWPIVQDVPVEIGGDSRAWNMAHLEGITNGLLLIGIAAAAPFFRLGARAQTWLFWSALVFAWLFTLPAIANAVFSTRGLEFGGGPFPGDVTINNIIYLFGWPPIIAVHIAFGLLAWGAWQKYSSLRTTDATPVMPGTSAPPGAPAPSGAAANTGGLIVRKIPFDFSEKIDPVWNAAKPEWSHMVNGASLAMPYLEPFMIRVVREALPQVADPALKEDLRGFIGQEGQHYQNHRRYNDLLKAKGYPELAAVEDAMSADYLRLQTKPLKWRVAYTAGFETMTIGITEWLIVNRSKLFGGADPSVTSLILWHMVEETEHKTVAFDLYRALYKDYPARIWGVLCASLHVVRFSRMAYIRMLKTDGRWSDPASRLRTLSTGLSFLWHVGRMLAGSMMPGYHPRRVTDPAWVAQWTSAYAHLPADHIPLLDTRNPEIPAQFAPA